VCFRRRELRQTRKSRRNDQQSYERVRATVPRGVHRVARVPVQLTDPGPITRGASYNDCGPRCSKRASW
jgi:hypothetical protein